MELTRTRQLIHGGVDVSQPVDGLIHILESAVELVALPDNDFSWSSWTNEAEAKAELHAIISTLKSGGLPDRISVSVLFAPTGPLQEVSVSSGWGDPFLKVAERYDEIERYVWSAG